MNEINFDWDDLKLFLAVARAQGLAGAAITSGKSAPTLGRRMLFLEKTLGMELFIRHPRGYALTDQGKDFLMKVERLEDQILPLRQSKGLDRPLVKISAGSWVTLFLCQQSAALTAHESKPMLRFISAEHVLDMTHREAVIGIRNQRPEQIGLAGQKLGRVAFAGYAASAAVAPWVRVQAKTPSALWLAAQTHANIGLEVTSPRNALDAALSGGVRALLPGFIGDHVEGLVRVTDDIDALAHDQWLVTHQDDRFLPEVRQVVDKIADLLKAAHKA